MARRRSRGRASVRVGAGELLGRALRTFLGSAGPVSAVVLATVLPVQLLLAWLFTALGIEQDAAWQARYAMLADLSVGSLTIPATYVVLRGCVEGPRLGVLGWVRRAYSEAVGVWIGSFVTRLMVSFAVGLAGVIPVLLGWALATSFRPGLAALSRDPVAAASDLSGGDLAVLLGLLPLAAGGVLVFLRFALADAVVALERIDGFAALERSKALTSGARGRIFLGVLALSAPLEVAGTLGLGAGASLGVLPGALVSSALLLAGALPGAFLVHVYLTQRAAERAAGPSRDSSVPGGDGPGRPGAPAERGRTAAKARQRPRDRD